MSKFKVGARVRALEDCGWSEKGSIYTVSECWYNSTTKRFYVRLVEHLSKSTGHSHHADSYELVEPNPVLTPEEVFEHLRKGTKLQWRPKGAPSKWYEPKTNTWGTELREIINLHWRIKPEPEVIELNGKRYKLIEE